MQAFCRHIASRITVAYKRLSIVKNPDGFLLCPSLQSALKQVCGIEVVAGSELQLRLHFELNYRQNPDARYCYLCEDPSSVLVDMRQEAFLCTFSIADLFPNFVDRQSLKYQKPDVLAALYAKHLIGRVSKADADQYLEKINVSIPLTVAEDDSNSEWLIFTWDKPSITIQRAAELFLKTMENGQQPEYEEDLIKLNDAFQSYIDNSYFAELNSSPMVRPHTVNKVLPYIDSHFGQDDRVALVVVDGMAYWQYQVLAEKLHIAGIETNDNAILAWIPTITKLSRQALFRGGSPTCEYKQSPLNEKELWLDYWKQRGFTFPQCQYIYDTDEFAINDSARRLAVVTTELDHKMHSSSDYADLLSLTKNWAGKFVEKVICLHELGFTLFITTDHGNLFAHGWRNLTVKEKVHLYADGSRGTRHLIWQNDEARKEFLKNNADLKLMAHDDWCVFRDDHCFKNNDTRMITHGGSHFWEVVIPFIIINKD